MSLPIGLQLWSIYEATAENMQKSLTEVKNMGYDGVEFAGFYEHGFEKIKEWVDDLDLKIAGSHVRMEDFLNNFEGVADYHESIGCKILVLPSLPAEYMDSMDSLTKTAVLFDEFAEKCKSREMGFAFHNHDREFKPVEGQVPLEVLFDHSSDDVKAQLDIGWAMTAGADVPYLLKKYAKRLVSVHVKETRQNPAITGKGSIDWPPIFKAVESITTADWYIIEHENYIDTPMADVAECVKSIKALM
jgi:sugar phosphate isomerase/epimerase